MVGRKVIFCTLWGGLQSFVLMDQFLKLSLKCQLEAKGFWIVIFLSIIHAPWAFPRLQILTTLAYYLQETDMPLKEGRPAKQEERATSLYCFLFLSPKFASVLAVLRLACNNLDDMLCRIKSIFQGQNHIWGTLVQSHSFMCLYFYCFTTHPIICNISTVRSWSSLLTVFWLDILARTVSSGLGYGLHLLFNPFIRFVIPRCISPDSDSCCGPVNAHELLPKLGHLLLIYLLIHSICNTLIHSRTSVFILQTSNDGLPVPSKGNDESTQIRSWIVLQKFLLNLLLPQPYPLPWIAAPSFWYCRPTTWLSSRLHSFPIFPHRIRPSANLLAL